MELPLGSLVLVSVAFLFICTAFVALFKRLEKPKRTKAPEPAGSLPIIGHLHLLGGKDRLLYRTLGGMAEGYGPAFGLRLGSRRAFVVSNWEVAKECFTVHDKALASRPKTAASKHMAYEYAVFGFAQYSSYWREMRKIATLELLSNRRLQKIKDVYTSQLANGIRDLYFSWSKKGGSSPILVDIKQWLENMNLNMMVKMVAGKENFSCLENTEDAREARQCLRSIERFFHLMGIFVISDALPIMGWFDLQGHEKEMKKTGRELDVILESWIEEHQRRRSVLGNIQPDSDFLDIMMSVSEEGKLGNLQFDARTCIKSTCLSIILGGSDTTAKTLIWAIALLLNNKAILKKAQEEIDHNVGKNRQVEDSDIQNLVYLQAIIKETMRLYPAGPLLAPREAIEDCTIAGYHIAAGTRLIINVWKIHRDPNVWQDADEFKPERFLTAPEADYDLRGHPFKLIPFGSGRRSCPGASLAMQVAHLTLARILHSFDLRTVSDAEVDMHESPALTFTKTTPLEVLLSPRHKKELYEC